MIYVYGICEPSSGVPARPGLDGAQLQAFDDAYLTAVYSCHDDLRLSASADLVLGHEQVVEAMLARGTVLPLRFGTRLDDEERLARELARRRDELVCGLHRVRGRVEVGVRVLREGSDGDQDQRGEPSGRAYLLARAAEHRRADEVARRLHTPLAERADADVLREHRTPPEVMVGAYLVAADRVTEFSRNARSLAARYPDLRTHVSGPWPPYNFVTEERTR